MNTREQCHRLLCMFYCQGSCRVIQVAIHWPENHIPPAFPYENDIYSPPAIYHTNFHSKHPLLFVFFLLLKLFYHFHFNFS